MPHLTELIRMPIFCCLQPSGSTVISFAQKTFVQGTLTSKLHVIELGAAAGALTASTNAEWSEYC